MVIFLTILFVALAAMFSAAMSSIDNRPHFDESIFSKYPASFWSKADSWQAKRLTFTKYPVNAWHIAQSCMYLCFLFAMISFRPWVNSWVAIPVYIGVYGTVLIAVFNLCYNKLFKRK